MPRIYQTVAGQSCFTYQEKRSEFVAYLWPIVCKEDGAELIAQMRQQHTDACHVCSAYVIGDPEQALAAGFNDDGEPGGTAGKPMLNVLMQRKIGNVLAVVVRYFGGIKLGAGGLTRAYGQAVSGAVDAARLVDVVPMKALVVRVGFALEERVRHILQQYGAEIEEAIYGEQVHLVCRGQEHRMGELEHRLQEATGGKVAFEQKLSGKS